jgi:hypothetical protein
MDHVRAPGALRRSRVVAWYPLTITGAIVLGLFADSTAGPTALWRPLVASVALTALTFLLCTLVVRSQQRGAVLATTIIAAVMAPTATLTILVLATGAGLVVASVLVGRLRGTPFEWGTATRFGNVVGLILILTVGTPLAPSFAPDLGPPAARAASATSGPDVYVILLDGYPRADTLRETFGFDDEPFLDGMRRLGFDVAPRSRSNYTSTVLTLPSMLNAKHIAELIPDPPADLTHQYRALSGTLAHPSGFTSFAAQGYEIISIAPPQSYLRVGADRVLESGGLTDFELGLLRTGELPKLLPDLQRHWIHEQHRDGLGWSFRAVESLATQRGGRPKLVFAHVMAPHAPIVYAADGQAVDGWDCFPKGCSLFWGGHDLPFAEVRRAANGQLSWINQQVTALAERILRASEEPPVIVYLSDHGYRWDRADRDEMLRNLFMSYTPGRADVFPDDPTPIATLPRLANAYLPVQERVPSEESYWIDGAQADVTGLFDFEPWVPDR